MGAGKSIDTISEEFDSLATTKNYIDKGAFGEVFGPFTRNNKKYALKRVWISQAMPSDDFNAKAEAISKVWTSLKHKNLIEIHKVVLEPKVLYVVMEYVSGGSLRHLLDQSERIHREISNWTRQIAEGMLYLHETDIIHRDLKPSNIMLSKPFDPVNVHEEITIKIADFDEVREHEHTATLSFIGTCAYMAPEVLQEQWFSKSSDVWSYGVVVWEMVTGKRAHEGLADLVIIQRAMSGQKTLPIPESAPKAYIELLQGCLHKEKKSRLSFHNIFDHLLRIEGSIAEEAFEVCRRQFENELLAMRNAELEQNPLQMERQMVAEQSDYKVELHQTIQTQAVDKRGKKLGACGVAILDNELFVITDAHPEIEVYNLSTFEHSRNIKLFEVEDPGDIVACDKNKCIYIVDWTRPQLDDKLLRINASGKEDKQRLSLTDDECRLSLTRDANVLVTFHRRRKVIEYTSEWLLVFQIIFNDTNIHPIHAVKLSNGHLAICHARNHERTHRVCIVDDDGNLLKSFGGPKGAGDGQVNFPTYLAVDENDNIMVTDRDNGRVLLLNSRLELPAVLLSKKELRLPRAMFLDETNRRLFVADCDNDRNNGQVLVFSLK